MTVAADIAGQRFGRLVAIEPTGQSNYQGRRLWRCRCDCGGEAIVTVSRLRIGDTQSCGCLYRDKAAQMGGANRGSTRKGKHKLCRSREYGVWTTMKSRCYNPKADNYERYGGRGIQVCERWMDFANFYADMGPRPAGVSARGYALYSIERIDKDGDYEPGNCCWATADVQVANQRPRKTRGTWQAA